ncbi:response regulator transcription factor [Desulfosporosinus meridiei]|uniref:Stage 0 sporulation protein A homolog n=1 Tax=Desulfosporosinus meridiei (strain ATCC BAA-275 / DSM 13257 / KCTC 12902 / NCIMB 13706 / S10) TaxID=768704 RepID=J7ISF7_DESMD|nr:response regulator transcription factor [Desulfosporosinus meridiei]AFQ43124.1 response regulator with CheY-like receiver domain and winged-helix DNA-binding domain [Desulfosporosinus meridiei DSM 13257]
MLERLKVMLVDDDERIHTIVEHLVQKEGYDFSYAADGEKALQMFALEKPDLIILDVMLPEIDGFEVCRRIRQISNVPIILLSAKGDIVDKSVGFNMGADDYITKPFSPIELTLRIKAIFRRASLKEKSTSSSKNEDSIVIKDLEINNKSFEVQVRGEKVDFTSKEFELLWFMAEHPGQVFTREQLFDNLWGEKYLGSPGTITVFVRKIREKIELDPAHPEYLLTVWGVGYKFCD